MRIVVTPGKVRRTLEALGRITTEDMVLSGSLSASEMAAIVSLYQPWASGQEVKVDAVRRYQGTLYRCAQAHTTQADWTPPETPALWVEIAPAGVIPEWTAPTGAHDAYQIGDKVTHDNPNDGGVIWIYQSEIDANTTEPGRDGEFDRYWKPLEPA